MNQQTEILKLEVTQEDIDKAFEARKTNDYRPSLNCPVSNAANRLGVENFISSAGGYLYTSRHRTILWSGGPDCAKFQWEFDRRRRAKPTKFIFTKV